jgi:cell division protein FtsW
MCVGLIMIVMLVVGGMSFKHLIMIAIPALLLACALIIIEPYRFDRLMAFVNPWANPKGEGFQLIESLYSLGSGGLFGVGLFSSRQKYLYLPFAESDFIFSIIGEEFGFFGSCIIVLTFFVLIYFIVKIAISAKDRFGTLLCVGIASVIAVQVILNIAVVTGSIPPTGLPLPFISAGSTSLLVFMSAIGVVLNIDRQSRKSKI